MENNEKDILEKKESIVMDVKEIKETESKMDSSKEKSCEKVEKCVKQDTTCPKAEAIKLLQEILAELKKANAPKERHSGGFRGGNRNNFRGGGNRSFGNRDNRDNRGSRDSSSSSRGDRPQRDGDRNRNRNDRNS